MSFVLGTVKKNITVEAPSYSQFKSQHHGTLLIPPWNRHSHSIHLPLTSFHLMGLARVTASEYGRQAAGQSEARKLLKLSQGHDLIYPNQAEAIIPRLIETMEGTGHLCPGGDNFQEQPFE